MPANRHRGHAQQRRNRRDCLPFQFVEHDRGAPPRGKTFERAPDRRLRDEGLFQVAGVGHRIGKPQGLEAPPDRRAAPAVTADVD
jgi:hypothetical protein